MPSIKFFLDEHIPKAIAKGHMSKKAHLNHLQEALPFAGVLFAGTLLPNAASARIFIGSELIISFFFTIFIIANLSMLRDSYSRKTGK